jgi:tetratricopeptide (TPR) repeat protein
VIVEEPLSKEELQQRALDFLDGEPLEGPERCDAFLRAASMVRYSNPRLMVAFAEHALSLAGELDPQKHGAGEVVDCRCRAMIELGNAYRVADRLKEAGLTLGEAAALWNKGSRDEAVQARLHDYQASLYADRRNFAAAAQALDTVHAIYTTLGDSHRAGRALISKGIYRGYEGDEEGAIQFLRQGLTQIDPTLDPNLYFAAVQSEAYFLAVLGRLRDARKLLWSHHFPAEVVQARINRLKLLWVESLIQAGLGDQKAAEEGLRQVTRGFHEEELYYKGALAGLDLVRLWFRQGRMAEVREAVAGLVDIFRRYHIHREALAAATLLQTALEHGIEAGAILDSVIEFVRRAETQPKMNFEDWFMRP